MFAAARTGGGGGAAPQSRAGIRLLPPAGGELLRGLAYGEATSHAAPKAVGGVLVCAVHSGQCAPFIVLTAAARLLLRQHVSTRQVTSLSWVPCRLPETAVAVCQRVGAI